MSLRWPLLLLALGVSAVLPAVLPFPLTEVAARVRAAPFAAISCPGSAQAAGSLGTPMQGRDVDMS